jgi:hypothetical protein
MSLLNGFNMVAWFFDSPIMYLLNIQETLVVRRSQNMKLETA